MIFAEIQEADGEKLLVIRVVAPKDPNQETPDEVPKFNIYIDESWNTRDYITPALTDITNRTFTKDQITLMSPCEKPPEHLTVEKTKKIEAAHAATNPSETLVLITAEPDERDDYLTVLNAQTGQELKVNNQIELNDALCDFIKPLKQKTLVNLLLKVELESDESALIIEGFAARVDKDKNVYKLPLNDLSSEEWRQISLRIRGQSSAIKLTYSFEDLLLMRTIKGGIIL